jgi:hypothetical protein
LLFHYLKELLQQGLDFGRGGFNLRDFLDGRKLQRFHARRRSTTRRRSTGWHAIGGRSGRGR